MLNDLFGNLARISPESRRIKFDRTIEAFGLCWLAGFLGAKSSAGFLDDSVKSAQRSVDLSMIQ